MSPFPQKAAKLPNLGLKKTKTVFFGSPNKFSSRKNFFLPRWSWQTCLLAVILLFPLLIIFNVGHTQEMPLLTLEIPEAPLTISSPVFRLEGIADPISRVFLNEQTVLLRENGYFSELIPLREGINIIKVKASKPGKEKIEERIVVYSPPKSS